MYNVYPITSSIETYNTMISRLFSAISADQATQMANTDVFNAYLDHDYQVQIADATQFVYDLKEFMLRTNLNIAPHPASAINVPLNPVVVDSSMDNPTAFMASTVSTLGTDASSDGAVCQLLHCTAARCYEFVNGKTVTAQDGQVMKTWVAPILSDSKWGVTTITSAIYDTAAPDFEVASLLKQLQICKALDVYNKGIFFKTDMGSGVANFDLTSLSIDMGTVEDPVIGIEQTFAFANMVDISRKSSMSYAKAEKLVARDTANLIDSLDVAATASK